MIAIVYQTSPANKKYPNDSLYFFQSYIWLKLEYKTCFFSSNVIRYKAINTTDIHLPHVLYEKNEIVVFVI